MTGTSRGAAPTFLYKLGKKGQLPNLNEHSSMLTSATRGKILTLNSNELNSTLTIVIIGYLPLPLYIDFIS